MEPPAALSRIWIDLIGIRQLRTIAKLVNLVAPGSKITRKWLRPDWKRLKLLHGAGLCIGSMAWVAEQGNPAPEVSRIAPLPRDDMVNIG